MELKSRPPVAGCQTIRRQYEQLTNELWLRQEDKVEAEREIQRLNEEYMIARDGAERQRMRICRGKRWRIVTKPCNVSIRWKTD